MQVATAVVTPHLRADIARTVRPMLREVSRQTISCIGCHLRKVCMPLDVKDPKAIALFEQLVTARTRLHKGDVLFRAGDPFTALYAIRVGSCKTVTLTHDGVEQVSSYNLPGEIIGVESLGGGVHVCHAVALEDTEVCVLPYERMERLAHEDFGFQRWVHRLLSAALMRERTTTLMLGTMRAEQRLASFLLDLSSRYQLLGYSSTEFVLRMTRDEIGSQLGLKLETVSRLFSRFDEEGLIDVQGRVIKLRDRIGLQQLLASG